MLVNAWWLVAAFTGGILMLVFFFGLVGGNSRQDAYEEGLKIGESFGRAKFIGIPLVLPPGAKFTVSHERLICLKGENGESRAYYEKQGVEGEIPTEPGKIFKTEGVGGRVNIIG